MTEFETIFHRYYPSVLFYALKITGNRQTAEDLAMITFRLFWQNKDAINPGSEKAWLMITLKRRALNYLHAEKMRLRKMNGYKQTAIDVDNSHKEMHLKEYVIYQLYQAIAELPDQRRKIVKLRLEGYTCPQIASIMGIQRITVRNQLVLAYKKLRVDLYKELWTD